MALFFAGWNPACQDSAVTRLVRLQHQWGAVEVPLLPNGMATVVLPTGQTRRVLLAADAPGSPDDGLVGVVLIAMMSAILVGAFRALAETRRFLADDGVLSGRDARLILAEFLVLISAGALAALIAHWSGIICNLGGGVAAGVFPRALFGITGDLGEVRSPSNRSTLEDET